MRSNLSKVLKIGVLALLIVFSIAAISFAIGDADFETSTDVSVNVSGDAVKSQEALGTITLSNPLNYEAMVQSIADESIIILGETGVYLPCIVEQEKFTSPQAGIADLVKITCPNVGFTKTEFEDAMRQLLVAVADEYEESSLLQITKTRLYIEP